MPDRAGVQVIIPGTLYQRGHFLTWSSAQKRALLHHYGLTVVVNLWGVIDSHLEDIVYLCYPARSRHAGAMWELARWLANYLRRDDAQAALVHCESGVNRSVAFCAAVLSILANMPGAQALEQVMQAVPRARVHPALQADLAADLPRHAT